MTYPLDPKEPRLGSHVTADDGHVAELLTLKDGTAKVRRLCQPSGMHTIHSAHELRYVFGAVECPHTRREKGLPSQPSLDPNWKMSD